jgi:hypothetical protein
MYSESFETSAIPNADWTVRNDNPGSNTWVRTSTAAVSGSNSVCIINSTAYDQHVDELIGPSVDMTMIAGSSPVLTFKVAHAQRTSTSADKLQIYVSTTCGQTWSLRKAITGAALSTAGVMSTSFTPNSSQWVTQTVNLASYTGQTNLYYMFRFTSNGGNNIFIDDINILGSVGIDELSSNINFKVYPNPAESSSMIAFELLERAKVDIQLCDVVGRTVSSESKGELSAGTFEVPLSLTGIAPGVYFVNLTADNHTFTKKLIVK